MNDIFEKLHSGELYLPLDEGLVEEQKCYSRGQPMQSFA